MFRGEIKQKFQGAWKCQILKATASPCVEGGQVGEGWTGPEKFRGGGELEWGFEGRGRVGAGWPWQRLGGFRVFHDYQGPGRTAAETHVHVNLTGISKGPGPRSGPWLRRIRRVHCSTLHASRESALHAAFGALDPEVRFLGRFGARQAKPEPAEGSHDNSDGQALSAPGGSLPCTQACPRSCVLSTGSREERMAASGAARAG